MKTEHILCPKCEEPMILCKTKYRIYWRCNDYPVCDGTRIAESEMR